MSCKITDPYDGCVVGKQKMFDTCVPCVSATGSTQQTTPMEEDKKPNTFFEGVNLNTTLGSASNAFATVFLALKGQQNPMMIPTNGNSPDYYAAPPKPEKDNTPVILIVGILAVIALFGGIAYARRKK